MNHLLHALTVWLRKDHTIPEFQKITGLSPSFCSLLFNGKRQVSSDTMADIFRAMSPIDPAEALYWVVCFLRDQAPPDALQFIRILVDPDPVDERNAASEAADSLTAARNWFFERSATDPNLAELCLSLHRAIEGKLSDS